VCDRDSRAHRTITRRHPSEASITQPAEFGAELRRLRIEAGIGLAPFARRIFYTYGWVAECEQRVGAVPVQVCHEWNSAVHAAEYEGRPERRPLSREELQAFFDAADEHVERVGRSRRKGWLACFRDTTLFEVVYGWGLRRREAAMLDVTDFTANPAAAKLGRLGGCHVRYGKAMRGSPPRRRAVASVFVWAVEALEQYLTEVRPQYGCSAHPAVWLTERGGRISTRRIDDRFAFYRAVAGLPAELSVHCLRHSYVSHLIEDGVDPLFVQQQVGHSWASTTATCTTCEYVYSLITPPSRRRRWTARSSAGSGGAVRPAGGVWLRERCGRWVL
jgi:integrase/recombinase XerC